MCLKAMQVQRYYWTLKWPQNNPKIYFRIFFFSNFYQFAKIYMHANFHNRTRKNNRLCLFKDCSPYVLKSIWQDSGIEFLHVHKYFILAISYKETAIERKITLTRLDKKCEHLPNLENFANIRRFWLTEWPLLFFF